MNKKNFLVAFLMLCFVLTGAFAQEADVMPNKQNRPQNRLVNEVFAPLV